MMASVGITSYGLSKNTVNLCVASGVGVKANIVLCVKCGKQINSPCAGVRAERRRLYNDSACRKCEENIGSSGAGKTLCNEAKPIRLHIWVTG